ncbi:hypothetical protein B0537_03515 [Desulforamulus ferrireducens]|uniref:Uncharacterized protein n=1 Tax=Desulforamulus ferrireducens TaxID=1833852 RepID=A0A1S6ITZ1_9FIRM|nr:hypothetical protein B0537_03515 [Desulforamulus ferrireducens]
MPASIFFSNNRKDKAICKKTLFQWNLIISSPYKSFNLLNIRNRLGQDKIFIAITKKFIPY